MSSWQVNRIQSFATQATMALFLAAVPVAWAGDIGLETGGARYGFSGWGGGSELRQEEGFLNWNMPWGWDLGEKVRLQSRLETSVGWLGDSEHDAFIGTVGPGFELSHGRFPVSLECGWSPAVISRSEFASKDLGSLYQFTTHAGLNVDVLPHLRLSYRFQHMSNGGFSHPNPGLNLYFFGVSYLF